MSIAIRHLLTSLPDGPAAMPSETRLLPCPCCGGAASFAGSIFAPYVQCRSCGLSTDRFDCHGIPVGGEALREHLARMWNRRTDSRGMLMHLAHVSEALVRGVSKYCNEVGCDVDMGLLSEVQLIREMCMGIMKEGPNGT